METVYKWRLVKHRLFTCGYLLFVTEKGLIHIITAPTITSTSFLLIKYINRPAHEGGLR